MSRPVIGNAVHVLGVRRGLKGNIEQRSGGGGRGFLGFGCVADWVHAHKALLGYVEIGLGVASMLTPVGWVATTVFAAGMVLSAATTADSCASGQAGSCAFGVLSMAVGGSGFAAARMAAKLSISARLAAGFIRGGSP